VELCITLMIVAILSEDVFQGASNVRYSQSALALARQLVPASALASLITTLAATAQQRTWHEVNP
jgi:hypothetical protein